MKQRDGPFAAKTTTRLGFYPVDPTHPLDPKNQIVEARSANNALND
jgi:hypothetical protein